MLLLTAGSRAAFAAAWPQAIQSEMQEHLKVELVENDTQLRDLIVSLKPVAMLQSTAPQQSNTARILDLLLG